MIAKKLANVRESGLLTALAEVILIVLDSKNDGSERVAAFLFKKNQSAIRL